MVRANKHIERGVEFEFLLAQIKEYLVPLLFFQKGINKSM